MNMPQSSLSWTTFKLLSIVFLNPIEGEEKPFSAAECRKGRRTMNVVLKIKTVCIALMQSLGRFCSHFEKKKSYMKEKKKHIDKLSQPSRNSICVELQFRMLSLQLSHELSGEDEPGTRMFRICGEEP
jgi:hypothetical protein